MTKPNKLAFEALAEVLGSLDGKQFETNTNEVGGYYEDAAEIERRLALRGFKIVKIELGDDDPITSVTRARIYGRIDPRLPSELRRMVRRK